MSYLRFHLIFNLPLLILLVALNGSEDWLAGETLASGLVLLAVMVLFGALTVTYAAPLTKASYDVTQPLGFTASPF